MTGWAKFWSLFLSPATARFILALLALGVASYALYGLMNREVVANNRDALLLALGIVLGLSKDAYSYYFGSTARGDDKSEATPVTVKNTADNPVPTTEGETHEPV